MDARRYAATVGVFAAVLFLALAICVAGMISLFSDSEVLIEPDTGPLVAPVMFAVATVVLYLQLIAFGSRRASIVVDSVVSAVVTYLLFLVSGAVVYTFGTGRPLLGLLFITGNGVRPYAISVGVIAGVVALLFLLLVSVRQHGGARSAPQWWWERRDRDDR